MNAKSVRPDRSAEAIVDSLNPFPEREDETDLEARIRRRAYEIWEAAGRPEGQEQNHWLAAEKELSEPDISPLGTPTIPGDDIPSIRSARGTGIPDSQHARTGDDRYKSPAAPKMAGAPNPKKPPAEVPSNGKSVPTVSPTRAGKLSRK